MFEVNEYKIVFKRRWHSDTHSVIDVGGHKPEDNGRYDTVCEIYVKDNGAYYQKPRFTGIAKLHPIDRPDKIVGKKIALRNAIGGGADRYNCADFYKKSVRTAIWEAFWAWVATWPVNDKAEAINLLISVKNLWLEIEGEAFYDLNGGRDFDKALDILEGLK